MRLDPEATVALTLAETPLAPTEITRIGEEGVSKSTEIPPIASSTKNEVDSEWEETGFVARIVAVT